MRTIVITPEFPIADEAHLIEMMLNDGIDRVHLRHPSTSIEETARIIETISPRLYARLSLHDHYPLAIRYGLGGIHLNSRNSTPPAGFRGLVSCSCHSIEEIAMHGSEDYLFLSPIYDSISKIGYRSAYDHVVLADVCEFLSQRIVALGGVTPERLPELAAMGFAGAALLGYVWADGTEQGVSERIKRIKHALAQC